MHSLSVASSQPPRSPQTTPTASPTAAAAAGGTENGRAHSHGASAREKGSKVGAFNGSSAEVAEKKVRGNGQGKAISRVGMQRAQRVRAEGDRKGGRTARAAAGVGRNGRAHSHGASARGKGNKVRHAWREMS